MKELGPIAKLLVESAREGLGPDDAAIARVRGRVATAVATGAAATTAGAASAKAAVGAKAVVGASTVKTAAGIASAKLVAIAVVASVAIGGGVVVATRGGGEPAHGVPATQHASLPEQHVAPAPLAAPPVEPPPPADEPPVPAASIPIPPPMPAAKTHAAPKPSADPPLAPSPPTLGRENELFFAADDSLRDGHPADTLSTLAIYQRETGGRGQLVESAAALELEALCALHAPEVAAKLAAFDKRWPKSAERTRIAAACQGSTQTTQ